MENNVYYKLTEDERASINKVMEITLTNYDAYNLFIPVESLMVALEDLLYEYHKKEEELEDLKKDVEDNYRPIPYSEQV